MGLRLLYVTTRVQKVRFKRKKPRDHEENKSKKYSMIKYKGLKKTDLISQAGISSTVLAKLGRDEFVAMESISKICKALSCDVGDIMEIVDEEK